MNLKEATNELYYGVLDYLDTSPIDISKLFTNEAVYDLCYEYCINKQIAEAEAKADEKKLEEFYEQS